MKIIIFGSTGTIGRKLVAQSLANGHTLTAFARNPAKLNDLKNENLNYWEGNVLDPAEVEKAIAGHDAVFCALGAGRKGKVRAEGTRNIIVAMEKTGINRFICQTTLGAGESKENLNFFWKHIMFGWFLKEAYEDHEKQEKMITQSKLDWTIVRPAAFTDGTITGKYLHGFSPKAKKLKLKISRADVADFMLKQLKDTSYLRQTPGLSY